MVAKWIKYMSKNYWWHIFTFRIRLPIMVKRYVLINTISCPYEGFSYSWVLPYFSSYCTLHEYMVVHWANLDISSLISNSYRVCPVSKYSPSTNAKLFSKYRPLIFWTVKSFPKCFYWCPLYTIEIKRGMCKIWEDLSIGMSPIVKCDIQFLVHS